MSMATAGADFDASQIYYQGYSLGGGYGTLLFATAPEVRAAAFDVIGAPLFENRRLDPAPAAHKPAPNSGLIDRHCSTAITASHTSTASR
jgi:dienelactone hydrolase